VCKGDDLTKAPASKKIVYFVINKVENNLMEIERFCHEICLKEITGDSFVNQISIQDRFFVKCEDCNEGTLKKVNQVQFARFEIIKTDKWSAANNTSIFYFCMKSLNKRACNNIFDRFK
jgi:hypothetical protein